MNYIYIKYTSIFFVKKKKKSLITLETPTIWKCDALFTNSQ